MEMNNMEANAMKKKIITRNDTPVICLTDDELTLMEKFKHYFFAIDRTEVDTTFYILRDKGSADIDTTDYFAVSFNFENGASMIDSIFNNKTKFTLKYIIETGFNDIARLTPLGNKEEITCINIHWPEPIDDEDEQSESDEHDDEGVEVQYVPGYEHDVAPISIPKSFWQTGVNIGPLNPIWLGEKVEPLKPVEDN